MDTGDLGDLADGIVQDALPVHTEPPRDEFLPWHRVRKEFIRQFQWNELTIRMIKRRWRKVLQAEESHWSSGDASDEEVAQLPEGLKVERPLRCLVIPGDDLLDVRALWRDIQPLKCFVRYLGFNERHGSDQKGTRVHIANNAVSSLPQMARDSRVVGDRFQAIAKQSSQAFRYLREYGPFHMVNLDLCGSMFPNTDKDPTEYYSALHQLLAYQFANQTAEWLLFVTTMVKPSVVDSAALGKLCEPTRRNLAQHSAFEERFAKLLPPSTLQAEGAIDISGLSNDQIIQLFGVAFGKWLLSLCHASEPAWTVAMRRSYRYSINEEHGAAMLALAFELSPNLAAPVDAAGMSTVQIRPEIYPDERECAIKLAESVANIRDVDVDLDADPEMKMRLVMAQADLLEAAGFDRAAYLKWVAEDAD